MPVLARIPFGRRWCIAIAVACAGCPAATELPETLHATGHVRAGLLDSFELRSEWRVDSADDPADLAVTKRDASHGSHSLRVTFTAGRKGKSFLRRDVPLDLAQATTFSVDVKAETKGLALALALVTSPKSRYFESSAMSIPVADPTDENGGWTTIRFRLDGATWKCAETNWQFSSAVANPDKVERISLLLYTGGVEKGVVYLDALTVDRPTSEFMAGFPPRDLTVVCPTPTPDRWGRFQLDVAFEASHESPFDPWQIEVRADIVTPSGELHRAPGFVDADGSWHIRYMPLETGTYGYEVSVRNREGRITSRPSSFFVAGEAKPGPVRVSGRDPKLFKHADGDPFYPVGTNVAWASDFSPYFRRFADAGGTLVRLWLAPWSLPVASRSKAGEVDLAAADKLEEVLDLARRHGLRVQLVLAYHGEFLEGWMESPYAATNGGPCSVNAEFFTHPRARHAFRCFMRYVAARFATHEALFAWELFNEADLVPELTKGDVVFWHRAMARALRSYDPSRRPITTSVSRAGSAPRVEELHEIDFVQAHVYSKTLDTAMLDAMSHGLGTHKPFCFGEFGGDWRPRVDQEDAEGVRLRAGLWLSLVSCAAGTAMPWWWDTAIDPNHLWDAWRPVAALSRRFERRGRRFTFVNRALAEDEVNASRKPDAVVPNLARVQGIVSRSNGLVYVYDARALGDVTRTASVTPAGGSITVRGLVDGEFRVELWGAETEKPRSVERVVAEDGVLKLQLPVSSNPYAIHFAAERPVEPGLD
jgi:hypothetical protein